MLAEIYAGMFKEDFIVTITDFSPGAYNLSVSAIDVFEQSATVVLPFNIVGKSDLENLMKSPKSTWYCKRICCMVPFNVFKEMA